MFTLDATSFSTSVCDSVCSLAQLLKLILELNHRALHSLHSLSLPRLSVLINHSIPQSAPCLNLNTLTQIMQSDQIHTFLKRPLPVDLVCDCYSWDAVLYPENVLFLCVWVNCTL